MNDQHNLKICYIGGGSRNWAWVFIKDLTFESEIGGIVYLYDIDMDAARANEALGNLVMKNASSRWHFQAESSLPAALDGADFTFISVLPGDFEQMAVDVHAPERYGIYQSVGDTVGAGGLNRSLRTVPMFQEFAHAIRRYAPHTWVLNYTNPMTVCTRTLYKTFPQIKAFGCCHEVFGTQKLLKTIAENAGLAPAGSIRREEIITSVNGINHFTWIDRAAYKQHDLFPLYRQFAEQYAESGWEAGGDDNWLNSFFASAERVKIDLFRRFGLIAAAGDRHLAEFCPPSWYLKTPALAQSWKFTLTPVSWRIQQREELKAQSAAYRDGSRTLVPENSGEEGIRQIKALLGLGNLVSNVNLPNRGQSPGLQPEAVVETNALFSRDSVQPVISRPLPNPIQALVQQHIANQEGITEAAIQRNLELAYTVFQNDPQIRPLAPADARALFQELTEKTLPQSSGFRFAPSAQGSGARVQGSGIADISA